VQELRRYIKMFRDSGKYTICYMKVSGNWDCDREYTPQKPLHRVLCVNFLCTSGRTGFGLVHQADLRLSRPSTHQVT
jgi:hypothetical protein